MRPAARPYYLGGDFPVLSRFDVLMSFQNVFWVLDVASSSSARIDSLFSQCEFLMCICPFCVSVLYANMSLCYFECVLPVEGIIYFSGRFSSICYNNIM